MLKDRLENLLSAEIISGVTLGEKAILTANKSRAIYLCGDFVTASKLKFALTSTLKRAEIVAVGRENEDEHDVNLFPFANKISKFICGKLDYLIFLPSSMSTKFDLEHLKKCITLEKGKEFGYEKLIQTLSEFGYERVERVNIEGQFAVRGETIDIYLFSENLPIRVEFFDDEVEKIVQFDQSSMKLLENYDSLSIYPLTLKIGNDMVTSLCENAFFDEPTKIENECEVLSKSRENLSFSNKKLFASFEELFSNKKTIFTNTNTLDGYKNSSVGAKNYVTNFLSLKEDINIYKKDNVVILYAGQFVEILKEFLTSSGITYKMLSSDLDEIEEGNCYVSSEAFPFSYSFLNEHIIAIGNEDLYKAQKQNYKSTRSQFSYLPKIGDYVVHSFYGIGICKDIVRMKLSRFEKDYFVLEYKNGALLYLPTENSNNLSAYVGGDAPRLNTLGGKEWQTLKNKVKENLQELTIQLAQLYKERQEKKGFVYERMEDLETQFAEAFPYPLTPDQEQAVLDIDQDMESEKIMDRLICGDVGFGKTEVAFRACFKAVYNSKQVAFLCPTTILSEQHFRSAKERFEKFGVRIEKLNRFNTQKETNEILKRLEKGEIDILIGTHKLLGKSVKFKDLGLLVLDEEQRFGVKDKEKIRGNIDVLTLSATPIPRTLHMSLSNIRDISVIATPPKDRLPIQTYVTDYSDELLVDVSKRELARGGKVLILFNKVQEIETFAMHVRLLLKDAKVGVMHGQMMERELANVIDDLYKDKYNVMISTTLIENGVDLPTLNTLFVVDSDKLGLAQLYQIRGRIGRSDKLAYAYLTYDKGKILTEDAYKRLEAINEFRELGSGFKIAARDLEIRGAGNILGREQHGHMQKVGYDMYLKLLDEVTKGIKNGAMSKEIKIEIPLDAYISEKYITSQEERIIYYDRISNIKSETEKEVVLADMQSSNGDVPTQTKNLCEVAYLKNLASNFNVKRIVINNTESKIYLEKTEEIIDKRLSNMAEVYHFRLNFEDLPILKLQTEGTILAKLKVMQNFFKDALEQKNKKIVPIT